MNFPTIMAALPTWVTESFPKIRMVLIIAAVVIAVALLVVILLQKSNGEGMDALSGAQTDTFYTKNKGRTVEGVLRRITVVLGILMFVLCVAFFVTILIYPVPVA